MTPRPSSATTQQTYCLTYRGCTLYLLQRLSEQQHPKTTFYIFDNEDNNRELAHAFYRNLGCREQAEAILKSWIDLYRRT